MPIFISICSVAALVGIMAPRLWRSRPIFAIAAAALLPILLLFARYRTVVRAGDWEGMGALASIVVACIWIVVTVVAGLTSLIVMRRAAWE